MSRTATVTRPDPTISRPFASKYAGTGLLTGQPFGQFEQVVRIEGEHANGTHVVAFEKRALQPYALRILDGRIIRVTPEQVTEAITAAGPYGALIYSNTDMKQVAFGGDTRAKVYRVTNGTVEVCTDRGFDGVPRSWKAVQSAAVFAARIARHAFAVEPLIISRPYDDSDD